MPRIGTPVLHATAPAACQGTYVQPMRDELATFRETHLQHLRQVNAALRVESLKILALCRQFLNYVADAQC